MAPITRNSFSRSEARQNVLATWERIKPLSSSPNLATIEEARHLKMQLEQQTGKPVLFVVHNYARAEVKQLADVIGDSFALAQQASELPQGSTVIQCTVDFMAETTAILRPDLKIVVPSHDGGCGLADYINGEQIRAWRATMASTLNIAESELPVVLYINTYANAKAEATVICTSANSLKVVNSLPQQNVLFAPDINLFHSIKGGTTKNILTWHGSCPIHQEFSVEMVAKALEMAQTSAPSSKIGIMIHPECTPELGRYVAEDLKHITSAVLSTNGMLDFVNAHPEISAWIVGTEIGLIESLREAFPNKTFLPIYEGSGCDQNYACPYMKSVTAESIVGVLRGLIAGNNDQISQFGKIISVAQEHAKKARVAIERMVEIGK